jgi:hypothetical protein
MSTNNGPTRMARRATVHEDTSQAWTEVLVWLQKYAEKG